MPWSGPHFPLPGEAFAMVTAMGEAEISVGSRVEEDSF